MLHFTSRLTAQIYTRCYHGNVKEVHSVGNHGYLTETYRVIIEGVMSTYRAHHGMAMI